MPKNIIPLTVTHPEIAAEWDYDKNGDLTPDKISYGSTKKVWWKCANGHSFEKAPIERTRITKNRTFQECPYCCGTWAIPGETSFAALHPELMKEWDWDENNKKGLDPDHLLPQSTKKASWICKEDPSHTWEATLGNRVSGGRKRNGSGCPYCDGKAFKEGLTDLATLFPEIAAEWDYEKNKETPNRVHNGATQKAWWICPEGHSYEASIGRRTRTHSGCPICDGKIVIPETSFATHYPEIANEWDYDKNALKPEEVAPKSTKKVWWICPEGHPSYKATIASRTSGGSGCPYCAGNRVAPGESFAELYPELLEDWDWNKNKISPYEIGKGSGQRVNWICHVCGHEWECVLHTRTDGHGCPNCRKGNTTSFAEQAIYLAACDLIGVDKVQNRAIIYDIELDILVPEFSLALEPGNWVHHKSKLEKDAEKRKICSANGIELFTLYDDYKEQIPPFDKRCFVTDKYFGSKSGRAALIDFFTQIFECSTDKTRLEIETIDWADVFERAMIESHRKVSYERSVAFKAPELVSEWHPTLNAPREPETTAAGSKQKIYWLCPEGHEYQATPENRISRHQGCNICTNKVADPRYNSISKLRPDMAAILSEDNGEYNADNVTPVNTTHLLKWECPHCGEEFVDYPKRLNQRKYIDCPNCGENISKRDI